MSCTKTCNTFTLGTKATYSYVRPCNSFALLVFVQLIYTRTCSELARNLLGTCKQTCKVLYQATYAKNSVLK